MLRSLFADPLVVNPEDRDFLNRMFPFNQTQYRYRYDGQMGIEDVSGSVVTRYGLGARGVDFIEQSTGTGSSVVFPVYDAHGNNVASLSRDGMGYQVSNRRSFDAWGNVRVGAQTGDPTGRYSANLGHKQDDESGLIYMRARYYEPTSGRFSTEDPAMDGGNWFVYCGNDPVNWADQNGRYRWKTGWQGQFGQLLMCISMDLVLVSMALSFSKEYAAATNLIGLASVFAAGALAGVEDFGPDGTTTLLTAFRILSQSQVLLAIIVGMGIASGEGAKSGVAFAATAAATAYSVMVLGALIWTLEEQ